jgi:predicted dehydrogenase
MRRNGDLARDYAQRHGVPRWYDDAQALIDDPEVDAVYIATPPNAHKEYTLAVAKAGKPVYVEKPMALNFAECQVMLDACRQAGTPLWVAYYRRRLPRFLKAKEVIESGAIGQPRSVQVTFYRTFRPFPPGAEMPWRFRPEIAGGGLFVDLGSHTLDYLGYFFGPIVQVQGFAANQGGYYAAEDAVVCSFTFANGVQGTGLWNFVSGVNFDQTEICGERGKLSFSSFGTEPLLLVSESDVRPIVVDHPQHVQQPLIQTIVDELNGIGRCPSSGESAAQTNWVIDQILRPKTAPVAAAGGDH